MYPYELRIALDTLTESIGLQEDLFMVRIQPTIYDTVVFYMDDGTHYVVDPNSGRIERRFNDTWRNPNHRIIIREGK